MFQSLLDIAPFTKNVAAINFKQDLCLSAEQKYAAYVADYCLKKFGADQRYIYANPYLSELLMIDNFDRKLRLELTHDYQKQLKSGDIIIWENWFSIVEHGITEHALDKNNALQHIYGIKGWDRGREIKFHVYRVN
jgi:hypothetical protein